MAAHKKYDVFLSHNSKDKPWVIKLKNALEARGINVWLDSDDIRPGDVFTEALEHGIEESKAVALIISPDAMRSNWVKEEYSRALRLAVNHDLQLIPVLYKKAKVPGFLDGRHRVDFSDESKFEERINDLIFGITGKRPINPPPLPAISQTTANTSIPTKPSPVSSQSGDTSQSTTPNTGPINEPADTLLERVVQFVLSTAVLVGLILAIRAGISMKFFGSTGIVEWIRASANPRLTLWVVSILIASVTISLPKLGIRSEWANDLSRLSHWMYTYLIGLSLWVTVPIIGAAIVGLFILQPVCQSPNATVRISSPSIGSVEYTNKPVQAKTGETVAINVSSNDSAVFYCSWSISGSVIRSLSSESLCDTQVNLSDESGRGIVTLALSKSTCSVVTTRPIEIVTIP